MDLESVLKGYKEFINEDEVKIVPIVDYVCRFCGKTYGELERANDHVAKCLRNLYDNHNCVTCKHSVYNLMPPYPRYMNKYEKLVEEGITSKYGYFTCANKNSIYNGTLSEEKVLRNDKECYETLELDENFSVKRTDEYEKYIALLDRGTREQKEIDNDIDDFYKTLSKLTNKGLSPEEIETELEKLYGEEDEQ